MKVVRYLKCRDWVVFSDQSSHMTPSLLNVCEFLMKNWKFWDMWFFGIFHYDPKILEILLKMRFFDNPFSRPPYFYLIDPWIKGFVIICDFASSKSGKKIIILEKNRKKTQKIPKKHDFQHFLWLQPWHLWSSKGTQNVCKQFILQALTPSSTQFGCMKQNFRKFQLEISQILDFQVLP